MGSRRLPAALLALVLLLSLPAAASAADQWFKVDTHVHSVVSGDALDDLGIISAAGKARGYNAMFVTDHQAGSNLATSTVIANHIGFDDDLGSKWDPDFFGAPSVHLAELATTPVKTGTKSLHVKATAPSGFGESYVIIKRGASLRSGDLILKFSAYPTRIDPGSGMYVSVALGGDVSDDPPDGYTTRDGTIHPGKSTILVWQLGNARTPSSDPNARVVTDSLPYTLNAWNDYEVNLTTGAIKRNGAAVPSSGGGIDGIPAADKPLDYDAVNKMKMSAAASGGGTAEGYFDAYNLDASVPVPTGEEFAYRNTVLNPYNTADFKLFPSIEMGTNRHVQRFNFDIASGSEYNAFFQCDSLGNNCKIRRGIDGIFPTQQTGYPAQLNHPNLPGGVTADEMAADNYNAFGADLMETREDPAAVPINTMIQLWDEVLKRRNVVVGTWSSDMHKIETLDTGTRGAATYVRSPSLDFDELLRRIYEGRTYMAVHSFPGRLVFNLDPSSPEPQPARYPVQVSDGLASRDVHLAISGGIPAGGHVVWIVNGTEVASDSPSGDSYEATRNVSLAGPWTYVRAEVRRADGIRIAMTEPIIFSDVAGLPADSSFGVRGVTTANGRGYTRIATKGITATSWNDAGKSLSVTLANPPSASTRLDMDTGALVPTALQLDGTAIAKVGTSAELDAASGSAWRYDDVAHRLEVKVLQPLTATELQAQFSGGAPDTEKPSAPATLTADAASPTRIDLAWSAASDDRGVTGYRVRRGPCGSGTVIATLGGGATSYADTTVTGGTTASYQVEALDAAGNVSPLSPCATATTPSTATATFTAVADTYVAADAPSTRYGTAAKLRADASPDTRTYLRFDLSGLQGTVTKATLITGATSASSAGYDVRRVDDTTWSESLTSYSNAPAFAAGAPIGASKAFASGGSPAVDVTSAVTGNGTLSFALTTPSSTALSLASREAGAATAPRLVVETSSGTPPPPPPPPTSATFAPVADSYVQADLPTNKYGTATKLRADGSPDTRSYLRFDVSGLQGSVTRARLVMTATSASSTGFDVRRVSDNTWAEATLTYANAPPFEPGLPLGSSLGFASGGTPTVDVTPAVAGNGTVSFALTTPSSTALSLASREAGAPAPRLVVDTSG